MEDEISGPWLQMMYADNEQMEEQIQQSQRETDIKCDMPFQKKKKFDKMPKKQVIRLDQLENEQNKG